MTTPTADAVHTAARRLRGQLVATPVVAASTGLPGMTPGRDLRLKLEVLQPSGGVDYRGALHYLLRQLGRCKGIAVAAGLRRAYAVALAAALLRVPVRCFWNPASWNGALREGWGERFSAMGCEQEITPDPESAAQAFCGKAGYRQMPGIEEPEVAAGLATVGLELAGELPRHCARLFVAEQLAPAVSAGLAAGGHGAELVPIPSAAAPAGLAGALAREHRVLADPEGLAALAAALGHGERDCDAALLSS